MHELMVVGGGRMGAALVAGLLHAGWEPSSMVVAEKQPERREELATILPGVEIIDQPDGSEATAQTVAAVVLAVKPHDAEEACRVANTRSARRALSIMAGIPIASLCRWLDPGTSVLRAMPNTPALVGAGMSAVAEGPGTPASDLQWASSILGAVGEVVEVEEPALDAVTGLSGSGPAYVFLVTEALAQAGVAAGLPQEVSRVLARQTVIGAGRLLEESEDSPEALRAQVTSPGGTTAAGISSLEADGFSELLTRAVGAATRRSRELGA